jgi:hypothetical protein
VDGKHNKRQLSGATLCGPADCGYDRSLWGGAAYHRGCWVSADGDQIRLKGSTVTTLRIPALYMTGNQTRGIRLTLRIAYAEGLDKFESLHFAAVFRFLTITVTPRPSRLVHTVPRWSTPSNLI